MRIDRVMLQAKGNFRGDLIEKVLLKLIGQSHDCAKLTDDVYCVSVFDNEDAVINLSLSLRAISEDVKMILKGIQVPVFLESFIHLFKYVKTNTIIAISEIADYDMTIIPECFRLIQNIDPETLMTVKEYIESGRSPTHTAKLLYVHRNTVTYRVDRFESETNLSLKVPSVAMFIYRVISKYLVSIHQGGINI